MTITAKDEFYVKSFLHFILNKVSHSRRFCCLRLLVCRHQNFSQFWVCCHNLWFATQILNFFCKLSVCLFFKGAVAQRTDNKRLRKSKNKADKSHPISPASYETDVVLMVFSKMFILYKWWEDRINPFFKLKTENIHSEECMERNFYEWRNHPTRHKNCYETMFVMKQCCYETKFVMKQCCYETMLLWNNVRRDFMKQGVLKLSS